MGVYAEILNGVIVNTMMASPKDYFDPRYQWCDITNYMPQPCIGWTTADDVNFTNPNPDPPPPTQIQTLSASLNSVVSDLSLVIQYSGGMSAADIAISEQNCLQQNQQNFTPNELALWQSVVSYVSLDGGQPVQQKGPPGQQVGSPI